jgi:hypothetical protein
MYIRLPVMIADRLSQTSLNTPYRRVNAILVSLFVLCILPPQAAVSADREQLADALHSLNPVVLSGKQREDASSMVQEHLWARIQHANDQSRVEWRSINGREDWERFCKPRLEALRESLGQFPTPPRKLEVRVTHRLSGDGFEIENILFESRPGLWVTANLYLPSRRPESMPGLLICHSHHRPKTQGELQDMGMTWARSGCAVLVMDQLGHGERRQHPFRTADDYPESFPVSRQDYYFRFDTGIQLHLVGDSLMGWMVWDLMRGVDLLLGLQSIDSKRIILLGSVAGGGDSAAAAGALDPRITAVAPFNFGGPQPETQYPLPEDAELSFNYAGSGSWESTRNLRRSASDGFLPWVIVGGIAPRHLVYAHEFSWDRNRDPVWRRLNEIYGFYNKPEYLSFTHGHGLLTESPTVASHCTNIGPVHRNAIHSAFRRWFDIPVTPQEEFSNRREEHELICMTPEAERELKPKRLVDLLPDLAAERSRSVRRHLVESPPAARTRLLRKEWTRVLGDVEPTGSPSILSTESENLFGAKVERITLKVEPGIVVPMLLLLPNQNGEKRLPMAIGIAQAGKEGFLRHRSGEIAELLLGGVGVCLPDLRGTGETGSDEDRGYRSAATAHSSTELMLGGTMTGARLRDLRSVLRYLQGRRDVDPNNISIWGDSFTGVNPPDTDFQVPRGISPRPAQSEPLGGLLVLLTSLYEDEIHAIYVHSGLSGFYSVLTSQFVYIPHDAVIPGALTSGDLCDVAAALAPRPLCLDGFVDGLNVRLSTEKVCEVFEPALISYRDAQAGDRLTIDEEGESPAHWLLAHIRARR